MILMAAPYVTTAEEKKLESFQFSLPVDWTTSKHYNLLVTIPQGYQSLQPISSWDKGPLVEFVPKGENGNDWSEIVTIHKIIGRGVFANQITDSLLKTIPAQASQSHIVINEKSSHDFGLITEIIISYSYQGQKEVLGAKYFSGPFDCVGVQYTIRVGMHSEDACIKKIKNFFDQDIALRS